MKKIVGFFGIFALIAGFVTSCGDDDDDDEVFVQKRLVRLATGGESSEFKYDSDGRCVAYNLFKDREIYFKSSYKYEGNTMTIESYNNEIQQTYSASLNSKGYLEMREFIIGNDKIRFEYEYDNQGHLIVEYLFYEEGSVDTTRYEWENGNLVKKDNGAYIITYKYTNKNHMSPIENKSGLQFFTPYNFDGALDGLLGKPCKNIPVSFVENFAEEGDMVLDYLKGTETASKWMFDKNGYPISVVYDGGNGKCATEFVWE